MLRAIRLMMVRSTIRLRRSPPSALQRSSKTRFLTACAFDFADMTVTSGMLFFRYDRVIPYVGRKFKPEFTEHPVYDMIELKSGKPRRRRHPAADAEKRERKREKWSIFLSSIPAGTTNM